MFLRWFYRESTRERIEALEGRVAALEERLEALESKADTEVYVNEDGEKVPMAQVISEYLYGEDKSNE